MTQSYISRERDIPRVSLLVAYRSEPLCWVPVRRETKGRGKEVYGLKAGRVRMNTGYAALAQLVEQLTLNQWVPGSSP